MFYLNKHVPDPYINKSRDFQLLCNSFDLIQNASKFDIDSILRVNSVDSCPDQLLKHLSVKLGLFSRRDIPSKQLRLILSGFPYMIRSKGTLSGIILCTKLFLNSVNHNNRCAVTIDNEQYVVKIKLGTKVDDTSLLRDLLSYVIPSGYTVEFYMGDDITAEGSDTTFVYAWSDLETFVTSESTSVALDTSMYKNEQRETADDLGGQSVTYKVVLSSDTENTAPDSSYKYISSTLSASAYKDSSDTPGGQPATPTQEEEE